MKYNVNLSNAPDKKIKRPGGAVWFLMLMKRLFFKPGFVVLLLLIPALGFAMSVASKEESGITTVMLYAEGEEGSVSDEIVKSLASSDSIVRFIVAKDEDEAIDKVLYGKAEAAWIIPADVDVLIAEYASDLSKDVTLASVVQASETPILRLVREKLNGAIFPYVSHELYKTFALDAEKVGLDEPDAAEFDSYYAKAAFRESIVKYVYVGSASAPDGGTSYLLSPVRGLSALAALLCTFAAALYGMQDEKNGFFSRIPLRMRLPVHFASTLAAGIVSSAMVTLSLALSGNFTSVLPELGAAVSLAITSSALAAALCRVFSSPFALGAAIPPTVIVAAVVCPIFLGLKFPARIEMLFPVTYTVRAVRQPRYILFALVYAAAALAVGFVLDLVRRRRAL